VCDTLLVK